MYLHSRHGIEGATSLQMSRYSSKSRIRPLFVLLSADSNICQTMLRMVYESVVYSATLFGLGVLGQQTEGRGRKVAQQTHLPSW